MNPEKQIIVTHCVDPHKFYFKYVNDCVNAEYSKFDYNVQCYGNELYARKHWSEYIPNKSETIIFFDLVLNKWIRGRVTNVDEDEITVWCIDHGVIRKCSKEFVQPLNEKLQREFDLVHIGGLSVLPSEHKLNFDTLDVEMQVAHSWDDGITNNFKMIIDAAKHISFSEDMALDKHKFGSLFTASKTDKVVLINEILLQMNKAVSCVGSVEDMTAYVFERRSKQEVSQSYGKHSSTPTPKLVKCKIPLPSKSQVEVHSKSKAVGSNPSTVASSQPKLAEHLKSKGLFKEVIKSERGVQSKAFESKSASNSSGKNGMNEYLQPIEREKEVESKVFESKSASGKNGMDVECKSKKSGKFGKSTVEVQSTVVGSKKSEKPDTEERSQLVKVKEQSNASIASEVKVDSVAFESKSSSASGAIEEDSKAIESKPTQSNVSGKSKMDVEFNPFIRQKMSTVSAKPESRKYLQPVDSKGASKTSIRNSEKQVESKAIQSKPITSIPSNKSPVDVEFNPFIRQKSSNVLRECKNKLNCVTESSFGSKFTISVRQAEQNGDEINAKNNIVASKPNNFSQKNDTVVSSLDESVKNSNSLENQPSEKLESHQNGDATKAIQHNGNSKKFLGIIQSGIMRLPMQSSMDWINNRVNESVVNNDLDRNLYCANGTINSIDSDSTMSSE